MTENKTERRAPKGDVFTTFFEYFELLIYAVVIALVMITFFFRIGFVDGSSMENTMDDGDCYLVSNLFYQPKRGDIVVFEPDPEIIGTKAGIKEVLYVKRVIAVGGDHVKIKVNEDKTTSVFINGAEIDEPYLDLWQVTDPRNGTDTLEIDVPEGQFFALGDNRIVSKDSRLIGCIDNRRLIGRVLFRFSPLSKIGVVQ